MFAAYVFSLVLGGAFLLVSVLGDVFGGDASDLGIDGGVDVDVHADFDVHTDVDVHGELDAQHDLALVSKVFSFRMLVYTLFGFGAVGWLMTKGGFPAAAPGTVVSALFGGAASGALVQSVFNYLKKTDSGQLKTEASFVGRPALVTLPMDRGSAGTIVVEAQGRRIKLRAVPLQDVEDSIVRGWKNVVIVEMKDGVARVTPVEEDLRALPDVPDP